MRILNNSLLAASAVVLVLSGCSQTYTGKDGSSVTVSGDGSKIAVKSGDGQTTVGTMNQQYPINMPVPQYPGSKISTNMAIAAQSSGANNNQTIVMLTSTDQPSQVVGFYKEKLAATGWKIESSIDNASASFVGAVNGSAHMNISIVPGTPDTCITLSLQ